MVIKKTTIFGIWQTTAQKLWDVGEMAPDSHHPPLTHSPCTQQTLYFHLLRE